MNHRQLASLLFWLDRVPHCPARWEIEALVLDALEGERRASSTPVRQSGVFPAVDGDE